MKKGHFNIFEKYDFSQNLFSSESVFLWKRLRYDAIKLFFSCYKKGLDVMFDDLDYKNDILTSSKN